jgi:hypothetical protein
LALVAPLGCYWALLVWGYALAWALPNDRAKLLTYWVLDATKAVGNPKIKIQSHAEIKGDTGQPVASQS